MAFRRRRMRLRRRRVGGVRRARRVLKRVKRIRRKKIARKKRNKLYFLGKSFAGHTEAAAGVIQITDPDPLNINETGLFSFLDIDEIIQQVKTQEDLIYPNMRFGGLPHNRLNIKAKAKGTVTYTVSNGNQAGAAWLEVYICKPRRGIPASGVGPTNLLGAANTINANLNQQFVTDYNDSVPITINAAGTGGVTNILQNAVVQTRPTIDQSNYVVTPYMVPAFTENWKVVKQLKYILPPGGQCMFQLKSKAILDRNHIRRGATGGQAITDHSIYRPRYGREVFFRFHGQPVHDSTTHTLVNYGRVALDYVATKKYWYNAVYGTRVPTYVLQTNQNQGVITNANLPSLPTEPVAET